MAQQIEQDLIEWRTRKRRHEQSLPAFVHCSLALFISVLFLSESAQATLRATSVKMAQQSEATEQDANPPSYLAQTTTKPSPQTQSTPPPQPEPKVLVSEVVVRGAKGKLQDTVYQAIRTKPGGISTRSQLQKDINAIFATGFFSNVQAVPEDTPKGVRVTFEVKSNPVLRSVRVEGNQVLPQQVVENIFKEQYGSILNLRRLDEGIKQLNKWYQNNGYTRSEIVNTPQLADNGTVTLKVAEGVVNVAENAATAQNGDRAAAQRAFAEGEQLQAQGTASSRLKAIEKYQEALPLWRAVGDRYFEALTLNNIGLVYSSLGEKQSSLDYYNQALSLARAVGERSSEAVTLEALTLNNIGSVYADLGEKQQALDYLNQALPLLHAVGDRSTEATTLYNIGSVYYELGEKQKALDYYNQALPLARAVSDRPGEATTLNNIGLVYFSLGEKQKALDYYNQALPLFRAMSDRLGEATTLNNIGLVYSSLGEKQKALDYYNQALPLRRAVSDRAKEASTLNNIGIVYSDLGEKQKALDYYNQALPLARAVGDRSGEATTLAAIGNVYSSWGEKQKALDYYNQALLLQRAVSDRSGETTTLNNIGSIYDSLGEKQKALDYYNQALPLRRAVSDRSGEAATLNNIGLVYDSLGEKQKALDYYNQALPLLRAVSDRSSEGVALNNIGGIYDSLGEKQKALDYYNQALPLARAVSDRSSEARLLNNIGLVYSSLGEKQKALDYYNQALPLARAVSDRSQEAGTLNNIGSVYDSLGEKQKALDYYNQSLPLSRAVGDKAGEAGTLGNVAIVYRDRGNLNDAKTQIEAALEIIESLRTKVASPELRASYFASVQGYYKFKIDLLMQLHKQQPSKGYDALALQTSERARARSLLELLTEANVDIRTGVEPKLLERERTLLSQLDAAQQRRVQLLSGKNTPAQAATIEKEISALQEQYQQVQAQIRQTSPRYAALTQPSGLSLAQMQQLLDRDTVLLEYSLGSERSYLWAVTPTGISSYELPKQQEIEKAARRFSQLLTDKRYAYVKQELASVSAKLSQMLLGPVANQLGHKRLVVVSSGALQYIPFAALSEPKATPSSNQPVPPLLVQHEIVSLPSASTLAVTRRELAGRKVAAKTVAVFADPVFSLQDERVQRRTPLPSETESLALASVERSAADVGVANAGQSLPRLPGTRLEAERILALVPPSKRKQALGFAANRLAATSPELSQYRLIHFGTHGLLNNENPQLSGVVLSLVDQQGKPQDGFLGLTQVYNLNLSAELVVLSACQTGLGQDIQGEGLVGLTRGFMYAGTPRVVASMWDVDDAATAELMQRFYQGMLKQKRSPAAALRAAQVAMWREQHLSAPYYWAAFVFQGEWR